MGILSGANFKRAYFYLKRNGFKNTCYAVREELSSRRKKSYTPAAPSAEELDKQKVWSEENPEVLFSVVVPTYKTPEKFLCEMVTSVLTQTYGRLELILADATPDSSVKEALDKYISGEGAALKPERIVYIKLQSQHEIHNI